MTIRIELIVVILLYVYVAIKMKQLNIIHLMSAPEGNS
jgi:hypothetical protein